MSVLHNRQNPLESTLNFLVHTVNTPPVSEPLTNRGVLLSTLLQDILHPSHHLLTVFLQIANKLGLSNKKNKVNNLKSFQCCYIRTYGNQEYKQAENESLLVYRQTAKLSHKPLFIFSGKQTRNHVEYNIF
jgi:hypothetical protein